MRKIVFSILFVVYLFQYGDGYSYTFGDCPKIKSVEDFKMTKFLGVWYGVEANDNEVTCTKFTFKVSNDSVKYTVEESNNLRHITFVQYFFSRSGQISVRQPDNPASMKIKWHWSSPSEDMVVFDTDYRNYAGIFLCSKAMIASQTRIFILSRKTNLTTDYIDKVEESLKLNRYSARGMKKIEQKDCPTRNSNDTLKINLKLDSLSPKKMGREIEKKIKDNFEKKESNDEEETTTTN